MRCKACDSMMQESDMYMREVVLADGTTKRVMEDLCKPCRSHVVLDDECDDVTKEFVEFVNAVLSKYVKVKGEDEYD